jgi:spore germination protein KB
MNSGKISNAQLVFIILLIRIVPSLQHLPQVSEPPANQDVWISILLSAAYSFIIVIPALYLSKKEGFGSQGLYSTAKDSLGSIAGKLVITLYILFFLYESVILVLSMSDFAFFVLLSAAPEYITALLFLITGAYLSIKGVETISRLTVIVIPVLILLILILVGVEASNMEFSRLLPVLRASTPRDIHTGAVSGAANYTDIIAITLLASRVSDEASEKKIWRSFAIASVISTAIMVILAISVQTTFGIVMSAKYRYPLYTFLKLADYHFFLQSIESVSVLLWVIGSCCRLALYVAFAAEGVEAVCNKRLIHIQSQKPKREQAPSNNNAAALKAPPKSASRVLIPAAAATVIYAACSYFLGNMTVQPNLLISYPVSTFVKLPFVFFIPLALMAARMIRSFTSRRLGV